MGKPCRETPGLWDDDNNPEKSILDLLSLILRLAIQVVRKRIMRVIKAKQTQRHSREAIAVVVSSTEAQGGPVLLVLCLQVAAPPKISVVKDIPDVVMKESQQVQIFEAEQ